MIFVLTVITVIIALVDSQSNMCKDDSHFLGTVIATGTTTCSSLSTFLVTKVPDKTAWEDVTCTEVADTTWNDGNESVMDYLELYGSTCCGDKPEVRCLDYSNMCTHESDFSGSTIAGGSTTCSDVSYMLLTKIPGKTTWTDVDCSEVEDITWDSGNESVEGHMKTYGPICCGGAAANVRCDDEGESDDTIVILVGGVAVVLLIVGIGTYKYHSSNKLKLETVPTSVTETL